MNSDDDSAYSFSSTSSTSSYEAEDRDDPVDRLNLECDVCDKVFSHESTLRRHRKDHEAQHCRGIDNEEYICYSCDKPKLFYLKRVFNAHMKKWHGVDSDVSWCSFCRQRFSDAETLKSHLCDKKRKIEESSAKKKRQYESVENGETRRSPRKQKRLLRKRIASVGKPSPLPSVASDATSTDHEELVDKRVSVGSVEQMPPAEPYSPADSAPMSQPVAEDSVSTDEETPDPISVSKISVQKHDQSSSVVDAEKTPETKNFSCASCSRKFYTEETLRMHAEVHERRAQIHYCSHCDFCSASQFAFALHVLDHYKKNYKCSSCDRSFYTKTTMELHAETHLPS